VFVRLSSRFAFNAGKSRAIFRFVETRTVLAVEDLADDLWIMRGHGYLMVPGGKFGCSPRDLARLGEGMEIGRCTLVVSLGPSDIHEYNNIGFQVLPES